LTGAWADAARLGKLMKLRALLLAVLAAVVIGLMVWLAHYARIPMGLSVYANSSFTARIFDLALTAMLAVVLVLGLMSLAKRAAPAAPFLAFMTWGGPLLGLLAGLREGSVIWFAVQMTHTTNFRVVAPSIVEALAMPAIGLVAGALASAFAARSKA
jgi:hypothetical protein